MARQDFIDRILDTIDTWDISGSGIVGVDGYIDKIQQPVQSQEDGGNTHFPTLDEFGQHVQLAAGKSAQVELDTSRVKPGGNAPIMSHALGSLGVSNVCLGTLGEGDILEVFQTMNSKCQLITLGRPAESNALEFTDGKLILSDLSAFQRIDWPHMRTTVGLQKLQDMASKTDVLALVGWCNPPHATEIWRGLLEEVLRPLDTSKPKVFFDLADPSKKTDEQIMEVLGLMNEFSELADVTLGLNENETIKLYQAVCRSKGVSDDLQDLEALSSYLFEQMTINLLLVHPLDRCLAINRKGAVELSGHLVSSPKVSTGGGDNFNAGFCFGQMANRPIEECMLLAMATSGAYVQNGESPDIPALKAFLSQMLEN